MVCCDFLFLRYNALDAYFIYLDVPFVELLVHRSCLLAVVRRSTLGHARLLARRIDELLKF